MWKKNSINHPATSNVHYKAIKVSKQSVVTIPESGGGGSGSGGATKGLWKEDGESLKPCWNNPSPKDGEHSKGFILVSLTDGPEHHVSQIANAVVVARYLGATLVLPRIRGTRPGEMRNFGGIYDVKKFVKSLDGIIKIAKDQPDEVSIGNVTIAEVPTRVSEAYIATNIEPLFKMNGNLRLETKFPPLSMTNEKEFNYLDSLSCLAMFGTLELQPALKEVIDLMVKRLRALSHRSDGQFIAADLRVEMLEKRECQESGDSGTKWCYNAKAIGDFLWKIGFHRNTTIYLTQSKWHGMLDPLRNFYPKTYTKDDIMPADKKAKFLNANDPEFTKIIDFHVCTQSDVFLPAISGQFYTNVVGRRIASGKSQILVPTKSTYSSTRAYISPYISRKSHSAYSCFC
ncbi:hypothetical protein RHSIM_Rhsim03G0267800 [Rhododendron simsii]|uniref:O-fucosyltransferase family protein n=1 Tax=Rhododendron simsii TaxID=118357 RepID=A0A834LUT8_RHOSS|nr:hypothetical protein RHSIM_Rhsim03G0267800 [Rhododendron simsii]